MRSSAPPRWHVRKEAEYLMDYIDRQRIHSHIVSRYHLSMSILHLVITEGDGTNGANAGSKLFRDATNIHQIVKVLRTQNLGPDAYWKMEAHFFNKIDNFLSVLLPKPVISEIYQKACPDFLVNFERIPKPYRVKAIPNVIRKRRGSTASQHVSFKLSPKLEEGGHPKLHDRSTYKRRHSTSFNSFHAIQTQLNSKRDRHHGGFTTESLLFWKDKQTDWLDTAVSRCCRRKGSRHHTCEAIHNLDRIYIKTSFLILFAMIIGSLFVIFFYYKNGKFQANQAMKLALMTIGDRGKDLMTREFWMPQMFMSLMIGGLHTGDLWPNATLYNTNCSEHPIECQFDQFFASFTTISHSATVFSIFMYDVDEDRLLGVERYPDMDKNDSLDSTKILMMTYDGRCRRDRYYNTTSRRRDENIRVTNYRNCSYNPSDRMWYRKAQKLGTGRAEWTEPYKLYGRNDLYGVSYVAPVLWNQTNLIFVVAVTTDTLAIGISNEIIELPPGSMYMIFTPRFDVVSSSNNETYINGEWTCRSQELDSNGCQQHEMMTAGLEWMMNEYLPHPPTPCTTSAPIFGDLPVTQTPRFMEHNKSAQHEHFAGLTIDDEKGYQLSLFSFKINYLNLEPCNSIEHCVEDYSKVFVKELSLSDDDYTQYGYIAILNDQTFLQNIHSVYQYCWIFLVFMVLITCIFFVLNCRGSLTEKEQMEIAKQSGYLSKPSPEMGTNLELKLRKEVLSLPSRSKLKTPRPTKPRTFNIGDRIKTIGDRTGTIRFIGGLHDAGGKECALMDMDDRKEKELVPLSDVLEDLGRDGLPEWSNEDGQSNLYRDESASRWDVNELKNQELALTVSINRLSQQKTFDVKSLQSRSPVKDQNGHIAGRESYDQNDDDQSEEEKEEKKEVDVNDDDDDDEDYYTETEDMNLNGMDPEKTPIIQSSNIKGTNNKIDVFTRSPSNSPDQNAVKNSKCEETCYVSQKSFVLISFLLLAVSIFSMLAIWEFFTQHCTDYLYENIVAKQEWLSLKDRVQGVIERTETIHDVVTDRFYRNDMDLNDTNNLIVFLSTLMQSVTSSRSAGEVYSQSYIYVAIPDGTFYGVRYINEEATTTDLKAGIRDAANNMVYTQYLVNDAVWNGQRQAWTGSGNLIYDPRCREWYKNTLYYTFEGTNDQAFPNGSYTPFYTDHDSASSFITNCKEQKEAYNDMWNIEGGEKGQGNYHWNITWNIDEWKSNVYRYNGSADYRIGQIIWSRYLFSNADVGITATSTITDPSTGELLAIVAVDYTLDWLTGSISETADYYDDIDFKVGFYDDWQTWIFERYIVDTDNDEEGTGHKVLASTDGELLKPATQTEGCFGFLINTDDLMLPYDAEEYNDSLVRQYSRELIEIHGFDDLPVNESTSKDIRVPTQMPHLEAGRVQYHPGCGGDGECVSMDWVLMKTMNWTDAEVDDLAICLISAALFLIAVFSILRTFDAAEDLDVAEYSETYKKKMREYGHRAFVHEKSKTPTDAKVRIEHECDNSLIDDCPICETERYWTLMKKMKGLVIESAKAIWARKMNQRASSGETSILTTDEGKNFLANRANRHLATSNENNKVFRDCAWHACISAEHHHVPRKQMQFRFWSFVNSFWYDIPIQSIYIGHLILTFWEPYTPKMLKEDGLKKKVLIVSAVFHMVQWFDCAFVGLGRYFEFSIKEPFLTSLFELNYGYSHKYTRRVRQSKRIRSIRLRALYLAFLGPQCKRYWAHLVLVLVSTINFICMVKLRVAPFSYYLPLLPFLIVVRNDHILQFGRDFVAAVFYARAILISYMAFMLLFAMLAMCIFRDTVNADDLADTFSTFFSAFVTGFVFISTTENYAIVYDVIESCWDVNDSCASSSSVLVPVVTIAIFFCMAGMFCWIPMIIDVFEAAFEERKMISDRKKKIRKTNAIIASFIMLDFDGNHTIDKDEFQYLVSSSVLIDRDKLFKVFDENKNDELEIYEFVSSLMKESFWSKVLSSSHISQSKFKSWFECNLFRRENYLIYVFIILVIPVMGLAMVKGMQHRINDNTIDLLILFFYLLNFLEIHFRMFCYGPRRFWDLLKYPNPKYVVAALDKYKMESIGKRANFVEDNTFGSMRLTSSQRAWANKHLAAIRPLSILEKHTNSLMNRVEIGAFWICFGFFVLEIALTGVSAVTSLDEPDYWNESIFHNDFGQYLVVFFLIAVLLRMFTVIPSNRELLYVVSSVMRQFIEVILFLILFIYLWARIGCTLFGDGKKDIVLGEIYEPAEGMVATFDNLQYAMLALLQLMIGEGWHEVMYVNIIATEAGWALYFIIYIMMVSIIIANIFVSLLLANVDQLQEKQVHDEISRRSVKTKSFGRFAKQKKEFLKYQIEVHQDQAEVLEDQLHHIEDILQKQEIIRQQQQLANAIE